MLLPRWTFLMPIAETETPADIEHYSLAHLEHETLPRVHTAIPCDYPPLMRIERRVRTDHERYHVVPRGVFRGRASPHAGVHDT